MTAGQVKTTSPIRTAGLTEGAILAALVALFAIATRYLPLIGLATALLCPLPLAVLVIRQEFRVAAIAAAAAGLVGAVLAGPLVGVAILISFAPMGLAIGLGARRQWAPVKIVLVGTLVAALAMSASFLGLLGGGRTSLTAMVQEMVATQERGLAMAASLYARIGMPKAQIDAVTAQLRVVVQILPYLLPGVLVLSAAFTAWLNYEVARRVLRRFGYSLATLPPMSTWRLPVGAPWVIPLGFLMGAAGGSVRGLSALADAGTGLMLTALLVFMVQGLLTSWVIMGNIELTRVERIVALVFLISLSTALPLINIALFLLGVLDSTWKVRERWGLPRVRGAKP
jgi:uncharacterized protein YybS (DUF2232 family)